MTFVTALAYDFSRHTGRLWMPSACCTDMRGCIRLFEAIDPEVQRIETFAGSEPDTAYVRTAGGWQALR